MKSNKPVNKDLLRGFKEGFERAKANKKRVIASRRKRALKRKRIV